MIHRSGGTSRLATPYRQKAEHGAWGREHRVKTTNHENDQLESTPFGILDFVRYLLQQMTAQRNDQMTPKANDSEMSRPTSRLSLLYAPCAQLYAFSNPKSAI